MASVSVQGVEDRAVAFLMSTNPAQAGQVLGEVHVSTPEEIANSVVRARMAQNTWKALGIDGRITRIKKLETILAAHRDEFVTRTSQEMGMPRGLSENIVDGGLAAIAWACEHAPNILKPEILFNDGNEVNEQGYEPRGVMACVVAWNYPFGNFVASVVPSLIAGNTVVMKYSEEVPLFSVYLEKIIIESKILPDGVLGFVYGGGQVGASLIEQDVDFISFTGSSATGQKIYESAARRMIPVSLELGGSSPGLVFEDVEINDARAQSIFWKRFLNTGQFCDGLKRLIVHESVFESCVQKLAAFAATVHIGDPLQAEVDFGPLVAERQVVKLESQLEDAIQKGARVICGGRRPPGLNGAYFEPTILTNVTPDMRVWREEVFGPILPVVSFRDEAAALRLAHDTPYGLSAVLYTKDRTRWDRISSALQAGSVDDGTAHYYRPCNPFGGYRQSGVGRQGGASGLREMCQIKVKAYRV